MGESCLVLFKPGHGTPVFLAHGLGGAVMELRDLALRLDTDGPVYGIEARGLDGTVAPLDRVEDMATFHIAEIRRLQPHGPYRLVGFSFGGLVALEMAQQLTRAGETVGLLCMLDTYPHTRLWPLRFRVMAWLRLSRFWLSPTLWRALFRHYSGVLRDLPPARRWAFVANRARRAGGILFNIFGAAYRANNYLRPPGAPAAPPVATRRAAKPVYDATKAALDAYSPLAYAGDIVFIKAADETMLPIDADALWRPVTRKLQVHVLPGDHQALVHGDVTLLARRLSAFLGRTADAAPMSPPQRLQ